MRPLTKSSWPSATNYFLLAIQIVNAQERQFHAAMLYTCEGKLMIGDLQSHMRIRRDFAKCDDRVFWIAPDLSYEDQKILATKLDAWLTLNPNGIPYSVAHPGGVTFRDDVWVGNEPGQGLTCATFVVELFNELAIPFINKETWLAREGDDEWARHILNLIGADMSSEHKNAQMERIGTTTRIRPSDILAAGILINQVAEDPLLFATVSPCAEAIEIDLLRGGFKSEVQHPSFNE